VVCALHTNTIEDFWSQLKTAIMGIYHKITPTYLALYVAGAEFRYKNRLNDDILGARSRRYGFSIRSRV
jgi:hypothetical protein